ncbi:hypothetical protein MRS76_25760 [Rhizobiaceae bacterium n13]|uniref:hypothetical protein n=1 Tax=Ferirhizobium litorale TaxID=2927786 RepID=UPI0024B31A4D|nr:hypothetical protein [Fererhizobium litorale]MDI7865303.1 hypothetical protein [Fererhizobium litorale]
MTESAIYVKFSDEVVNAMQENGISVEMVLKAAKVEGLQVVEDPASSSGKRDIFMILLGSAAVVAAATPLITKVIQSILDRPIVTEDIEMTPSLDAGGKVIRDKHHQPVMTWKKSTKIDRGTTSDSLSAKIKADKTGIEIGVGKS